VKGSWICVELDQIFSQNQIPGSPSYCDDNSELKTPIGMSALHVLCRQASGGKMRIPKGVQTTNQSREKAALSRAIRPHNQGQRPQPHIDLSQHLEIPQGQALDHRRGSKPLLYNT
jgi:hypothetical protein